MGNCFSNDENAMNTGDDTIEKNSTRWSLRKSAEERPWENVPPGELTLSVTYQGGDAQDFKIFHNPLGVKLEPDTRVLATAHEKKGCMITHIEGPPAQIIGLKKDMVVTHINGRPVEDLTFTEISAILIQASKTLADWNPNTSFADKKPKVAAPKKGHKIPYAEKL